ncbi:MAG: hypothetical protein RBU30_11240 [Polyangia bacterium]|jgi:hypothetical protein|nr:hypothetical protein [Polyangia bacterium]
MSSLPSSNDSLGERRKMVFARIVRPCRIAVLVLLPALAACAKTDGGAKREGWPLLLALTGLEPVTVLPTTTLIVQGDGFVGSTLGTSRLRLVGTYTPDGGSPMALDLGLIGDVESTTEIRIRLGQGAAWAQICPFGQGVFTGTAAVEVSSLATGRVYSTSAIGAGFLCRERLEPLLVSLDSGAHALNASLSVLASDLLLGGNEGASFLSVRGCYLAQGLPAPCETNGVAFTERRIPLEVLHPTTREDARFLLTPALVGLGPGTIEAIAHVVNVHSDLIETTSEEQAATVTILPSHLDGVAAEGSSLGGFVDFYGAGFVGGGDGESTEIFVQGSFQPDEGGAARNVDLLLISTFESGEVVRYVLEEQDGVGEIVDLRQESGILSATFTPRFVLGASTITGAPYTDSFRVQPIRQVVHVRFLPGYRDALELFGMLAADWEIRQRIIAKADWIYRGINVEFRSEKPTDYLLYAQVDITGIDPNGMGLMGYDNSPGKDVGNLRLYDRLGGVNALTQEDGYPGFGGVFVESFLAFSMHPPQGLAQAPTASPLFDQIFDPLRPSRGGKPILPAELSGLVPLSTGDGCPAPSSDRQEVIRCAIFVLGNILGGTMAHELAHSLGLADPGGNGFHNSGEQPNRLMDAGGSRPFNERAELLGGGPEVFCQQNFEYLISILPTGEPDPISYRPSCY